VVRKRLNIQHDSGGEKTEEVKPMATIVGKNASLPTLRICGYVGKLRYIKGKTVRIVLDEGDVPEQIMDRVRVALEKEFGGKVE
jgi:hypothetical protein